MLQASSHCLCPCQQQKGLGRRWAFSSAVHALKFNVKRWEDLRTFWFNLVLRLPNLFSYALKRLGTLHGDEANSDSRLTCWVCGMHFHCTVFPVLVSAPGPRHVTAPLSLSTETPCTWPLDLPPQLPALAPCHTHQCMSKGDHRMHTLYEVNI